MKATSTIVSDQVGKYSQCRWEHKEREVALSPTSRLTSAYPESRSPHTISSSHCTLPNVVGYYVDR